MSNWMNFTDKELACQHCGVIPSTVRFYEFMTRVQLLRVWYDKPMAVTSAYRCLEHPIETYKETPGEHTRCAIDFQIPVEDRHRVVSKAFEMGFRGIGFNLKGPHSQRFIHLDDRQSSPRIWSY